MASTPSSTSRGPLAAHTRLDTTDLDEAREIAREALVEMIQEGEVRGADLRDWRLEAADASGAALFTIRLDALLG